MPPEPAFIFGLIFGVTAVLLIQAFGRRSARKAVAALGTLSEKQVESQRHIELLTNQNARQNGQIDRLQDRLAVLERLAVDPAERTARAIEDLR